MGAVAGVAASLACPQRTWADAPDKAADFVKVTADRILSAMKAAGSPEDRRKALRPIIDGAIDVDGIARFCLGRFWKGASADQQKRYVTLFHEVLIGNITSRLGEYQDVKVTVGKGQVRDENDSVATTVERTGAPPTTVEWIIANAAQAPKVIDVVAEGTSLRLTQRQDYAAFLTRNDGNIDKLIGAMKDQLADAK